MNVIPKNRHIERTIGMLAGALAGSALGALAGLGAALFGAIIGGWVGYASGIILEEEHVRRFESDRRLDDTIGVSGGPMGAAKPDETPVASTDEPTPSELRSRI